MRNLRHPTSFKSLTKALSLLFIAGASACAMPLEEGQMDQAEFGPAESKEQAIQNGQVYPTENNAGTVYLAIEWAPGQGDPRGENPTQRCSGQVVSRDSILLAAHCFYDVGYYANGWAESVWAKVSVLHQEPNGTWESLSGSKESMKVYIPSSYYFYEVSTASDADKRKVGIDVAVLRRSSNWSNTVSTDVTALASDQADQPSWLYLYGHGYYSDTQVDYKLRRGLFDTLTFYTDSANDYFGSIKYTAITDDPYSCTGDSGGPWKVPQFGTTVSGVQFGVHSQGINPADGRCTEDGSRAAMVPMTAQWIKGYVHGGAGACSNTSHYIRANPSMTWTIVDTITCW